MAPSVAVRAVICDDDPLIREVVGAVLQERGFAVAAEASNGAEVIQLTELLKPDVVVLDNALADALAAGVDLAMDKEHIGELGRRIAAVIAARAGAGAEPDTAAS